MPLKSNLRHTVWTTALLLIICFISFRYVDLPVALFTHHHFIGTALFNACSDIGAITKPSHWAILAVLVGIIGFYYKNQAQPERAYPRLLFAGSLVLALAICFVIKVVLARYRPVEYFTHGFYGFHGLSFKHPFNSLPSGHATAAFAGLMAIARLIKKPIFTVACILIAVAIAASRLVIDAHYLTDVILGGYIGFLSVCWVEALLQTIFNL